MTSRDIRAGFLDFFSGKGHRIVPSAPVIPFGDPTLLFTNAGMNQFKDVFLGTGKRDYLRAADSQKCIRVSGKHNDLEEVGRDTYHHTFFEMLGNWSFGDYYKKEAIAWAWELLTEVWEIDRKRLIATVFETDGEAEALWKSVTDIQPSHILRFGRKDNFWEMGDTGPCGPCSEIHIDLTPDRSGLAVVNAGDPRVMEIWNLVFIQHNRNERGELAPLPARHVDTGMGFERVCALLQGKSSNYDTDLFTPMIDAIAALSGRPYSGEGNQVAMRVIADHIRMLAFAIADGAMPGNDGRGYVLRRVLRRAARFGRNLGMREPFIYRLTGSVASIMGDAFPELVKNKDHTEKIIAAEEESFNATLDRGLEIFESVLERAGHSTTFPGEDAFRLYDTYGFPLDLTQLMAEERHLKVDVVRFTELMEEQRSRARESGRPGQVKITPEIAARLPEFGDSRFVGYGSTETTAVLEHALDDRFISLDQTPFYVESGGQVDDTGMIRGEHFLAEVIDSFRQDKKIIHEIRPLEGHPHELLGKPVRAIVDRPRRLNIQRNHSATHLVHEALRRVLGAHVHQQGSLVAPDRLRFDFAHTGKISLDELRAIEDIVNEKIEQNIPVYTEADLPIEKARKIPNVKMFFGDKYGDKVRVVFIDERFSVEFCGGTHVEGTRDIGLFKIVSESGVASGVRRIEAVTGEGLQQYLAGQVARIGQLDDRLAKLYEEKEALEKDLHGSAGSPPPARPTPLVVPETGGVVTRAALDSVERLLREREEAIERVTDETQEINRSLSRQRISAAAGSVDAIVASGAVLDGFRVVSAKVIVESMDELKSLGDALRLKLGSGVGILASVIGERVALVCVVTDDLIRLKKLEAGKIVGALAKEVGGGGGGRPHLATAGGRDVAKLDHALRQTHSIVRSMLGSHSS